MQATHSYPSRVGAGNVLLIAALLAVCIYMMWNGGGIAIGVALVVLVVVVERTIHTEYRLDSEQLTIHYGRLARDRHVPLGTIRRVERIRRIRVGRRAMVTYLLIVCTDGQSIAIRPRDEEAFVTQLIKASPNPSVGGEARAEGPVSLP